MSRDPIEEEGGLALYAFIRNDSPNLTDVLGLAEDPPPKIINGGKEIYYDILPNWFNHPEDEDKPCCCTDGAKLTKFARTDSPPTITGKSGTLHFQLVYELEGCFKDVAFIWYTCTRPSSTPGYPLESGRIPQCDGQTSCNMTFPTEWTPELTHGRIRYLSCESGKWVVRKATVGHTYIWNGKTWD